MNSNKILFPTDFSEVSLHALYFATNFCKKSNCTLILFHVVDVPFSDVHEDDKQEIDLLTRDLIAFSDAKLNELKEQVFKESGVIAETITYVGETTEAIIRAVKTLYPKKIIMGTKENKDLFFKSSSFLIVKNTSIPLLTLSMLAPVDEIKTILFPLNRRNVTLKKADEVLELARLYNSKVIFLGVSEANTPEKIQIITNQMMHIKSIFDDKRIENEVHFSSSSNYAEAILEFCNLNKVDLVTIANNHSNTLSGNLSLKTAKKVINNADIPVLTIPVWQGI